MELADELVRLIRRQYLAMVPLRSFAWSCSDAQTPSTESFQRAVLSTTVLCDISRAFPPSREYTRQFLKAFIAKVELEGEAVAEELYETYVTFLPTTAADSEWCYKTYVCGTDANAPHVTLRESTQLLSHGTTGLSTWEASLSLGEFILSHADLFRSKRVVELGAGLGFAGIVASRIAGARHVTLTDYDPHVLACLRHNAEVNASDERGECSEDLKGVRGILDVEELDWFDFSQATANRLCADVVLAADVVYDVALVPALVRTIRLFIAAGAVVYIASTQRNEATIAAFLNHISEGGVQSQTASADPCPRLFFYNRDVPIAIQRLGGGA